jgi:ElaA protein
MQTDPSTPQWQCCRFTELSLSALQHIYAARQAVFVVEQKCFYLDVDGLDEQAWHLAAWSPLHAQPLAYARLFPPGVKYAEASIGRVLTLDAVRGRGWGRLLVERAVAQCDTLFGGSALRISAQAHLERFYGGFGFHAVGKAYMEDGIPHIEMQRPAVPVTVKP